MNNNPESVNFPPPNQALSYQPKPQPKIWSKHEKLLLPAALLLGIGFDRLVVNHFFDGIHTVKIFSAIFWLCYLFIFYLCYWERLKKNKLLWLVSGCVAALAVWNFIFPHGNTAYSLITFLVIPGVLMAHAQWSAGKYTLHSVEDIAVAWFFGWFEKPFTGLPALVGVTGSLGTNRARWLKSAVVGLGCAIILLLIVIPLLAGADQMFGYFLFRIFDNFRFSQLIGHGLAVLIMFALFYSFLWNIGFRKTESLRMPETWRIDIVITTIVLGTVIAVYILFCIVLFTFLFARAGLPEGMTYAAYARQGFAQTVAVCIINLLLYGVFTRFAGSGKLLKVLLSGLMALTGIMLVSGAVRLNLYIETFGMTWLRMLSAWFIIYLAAVIALCAVRVVKKNMPVVVPCAILLLVWYIALGYVNPDGFIGWFNFNR